MSENPGRLTENQIRVLVILYDRQESGITLTSTRDIADALGTAPERVGQTTGSLVRRGYVLREKRGVRVTFRLTIKGEAVAGSVDGMGRQSIYYWRGVDVVD